LSPGGSSTVHIYTQTVHRTTQNKQYIEQPKNLWECGPWRNCYNKEFLRKAFYEAAFQTLESVEDHRRVLIAWTQLPVLTSETEDVEQRANVRKTIGFCGHYVFHVTAPWLYIIRNIPAYECHKVCNICCWDSLPGLQHASSDVLWTIWLLSTRSFSNSTHMILSIPRSP